MSSSSEDDSSLQGAENPPEADRTGPSYIGESGRLGQSDVPEMPAAERPAWRLCRRPVQAVHHAGDAVDDEERVVACRNRVVLAWCPSGVQGYAVMASKVVGV